MNINFEEKFDMVEDLWITIQTLKFYKPERGTHEFFHVSDTINWAEGKINLLFESAKNQYKEKIKELEAKEKQYKDQVEELHRDKDRIRQAQLKTFEEISKTPSGPIAPRALKPLQKANLSRKEKTEKRKIEIREGLIKYLKNKGGKHVISCNCSDRSTPEKKNEVKEVYKFTGCKDAKLIRRERNNLVEAGIIRRINLTAKTVTYELITEKPQEGQKNEKPRSVCPKCGSLALVRNEKKYQSDEERWTDKNGYFFTCLMCGEELEVEDDELQEAA